MWKQGNHCTAAVQGSGCCPWQFQCTRMDHAAGGVVKLPACLTGSPDKLALAPHSCIFTAESICICRFPVPLTIAPLTYIFAATFISECSLPMLFSITPLAYIFSAFSCKCSLPVHQIITPLAYIIVAVCQGICPPPMRLSITPLTYIFANLLFSSPKTVIPTFYRNICWTLNFGAIIEPQVSESY